MNTKQPKVILFGADPFIYEKIALAVSAWTEPNLPENVESMDRQEVLKKVKKALKVYHKTALEYANFTFLILNVSRAFQQQLTRTRQASYSIQSLRIADKSKFATNGEYTMPPSLDMKNQQEYHKHMMEVECEYAAMTKFYNIDTEDARSILPLSVHSNITLTINLNSLLHMLEQRMCLLTQWEFRQVALGIKNALIENGFDLIAEKIAAPCIPKGKCPMAEEYCGVPLWQLPNDIIGTETRQYVKINRENRKITYKGGFQTDSKEHSQELL